MIRILVVGGHQTGEGQIANILASQFDFELVGKGKDGYDALNMVRALKPDIVLLDENVPLIDAAEAIPVIKAQAPQTSIIVLTALSEGERILKAIRNGSSGYFRIQDDWERLILGIRMVYHGGCLMSPELAAKAYSPAFRPGKHDLFRGIIRNCPLDISRQEFRLIAYIAQGLSNKEIAHIFKLKTGTIRNYISLIFQKTGLRNRTEVAILAHSLGLKLKEAGREQRMANEQMKQAV
ncbi:MAG: response regulator transcription factor [Treponema sp.]|jgi:DNA-binding NarL/FixJ family response regulator|nr:response regulator transcription factor [Treponema sp.]